MGLPSVPSPRERVIVVVDTNRNKGPADALEWALKHVVRPGDAIVVVGVLCDLGKKHYSCFPKSMGIHISGIWEKLEFSSGHGEVNPRELGEEIERKREQFQSSLQPFYRQCKKNEVKLELKLCAGYCPAKITIEEAQDSNTRWIVLDSHLKKYKVLIYGHVGCNVAIMKGKDVATLMPSKAPHSTNSSPRNCKMTNFGVSTDNPQPENLQNGNHETLQEQDSSTLAATPQTPCWYPLSWRSDFPRAFTLTEVEEITNGLADENIIHIKENRKVYQGIFQDTPVLIQSFLENDECFWSKLMILYRISHRNILKLVGYCCTGTSRFLLSDFPCSGNLEKHLKADDLAKSLSWKARWYVAVEIGGSLRYLHEECGDGPIVHQSVSSSDIVFSHGCSAMLCNFGKAKVLKDDASCNQDSPAEYSKLEEDECLSKDVHDYGLVLLELITGKNAHEFAEQGEDQSLVDWALPLLNDDYSLTEVMDPRLMNTGDTRMVHKMAQAALLCLNNDHSGRKFSMSEALAVLRGNQLAILKC